MVNKKHMVNQCMHNNYIFHQAWSINVLSSCTASNAPSIVAHLNNIYWKTYIFNQFMIHRCTSQLLYSVLISICIISIHGYLLRSLYTQSVQYSIDAPSQNTKKNYPTGAFIDATYDFAGKTELPKKSSRFPNLLKAQMMRLKLLNP